MEGGPGVPIPGAAFISPISFQRQAATTASTARNCRSVWRKIQDHDTTLELPRQTSQARRSRSRSNPSGRKTSVYSRTAMSAPPASFQTISRLKSSQRRSSTHCKAGASRRRNASSGSPNSRRRSIGYSAPRRPLSSPPVCHARLDARRGSCWVLRS